MEIFILNELKTKEIYKQMLKFVQIAEEVGEKRECAFVIGGDQLTKIMKFKKHKKL